MTTGSSLPELARSSHRLPTVSASQALKEEQTAVPTNQILFGLETLDGLVGEAHRSQHSGKGLQRGKITEIYGPPGVGKTILCIQACASALQAGDGVIWVDTSTRLPITRLKQVLAGNNITNAGGSPKQDRLAEENVLDRLQHYHVPTLAHLIVLLLQSAPKFPGANTRLIVVDSLSALIDITYPRGTGDLAAAKQSEHARWLSGRRQAIVSDITGKLSKLAAVNNIAILVTNYATTKIRAGARAVIRPALTGSDWEKALGAGIILLRGWWPERGGKGKESDQRASRLAGVVKGCNGTSIERGAVDLALSFDIEEHGVKEISPAEEHQMLTQKHTAEVGSAKRPYAAIADSDRDDSGSEYGWADDDQIAAEGLVDDVVLVDSVSTEMAGTIAVPTLEIKDNDQSKT